MADIKFVVSVDAKTGIQTIKTLDEELEKLGQANRAGGAAAEESAGRHAGLWKQFSAGQIAADLLKKGLGLAKGAVIDLFEAAIEGEKTDRALEAALFTTGRTALGLSDHFKKLGAEIQRETIYNDEAVKSASTLLIQMTNLDRDGLDRATKGAAGLASVMGMDLQNAASLVQKALEGNWGTLSRYGIKVRETGTEEEKQAELLAKLTVFYERAKAETEAFSGRLAQLRNIWDDTKESVGGAIVKNERILELIERIKQTLEDFVSSGAADEWANRLAKAAEFAINIIERLRDATRGPFGIAGGLAEDIAGITNWTNTLKKEAYQKAVEFKESLKILRPSMEEIRKEFEKGPAAADAYVARMKALDESFDKNKGVIMRWLDSANKWLAGLGQAEKQTKDTGGSLKKMIDELKRLAENTDASHPAINKLEKALANLSKLSNIPKSDLKAISDRLIDLKIQAGESVPFALFVLARRLKEIETPLSRTSMAWDIFGKILFNAGYRIKGMVELGQTAIPAINKFSDAVAIGSGTLSGMNIAAEKLGIKLRSDLKKDFDIAVLSFNSLRKAGELTEKSNVDSIINIITKAKELGMRFSDLPIILQEAIKKLGISWGEIKTIQDEINQKILTNFQSVLGAVGGLFSSLGSLSNANLAQQMQNYDLEYQARKAAIDKMMLSEEERYAAYGALDEEYAKKKADLRKAEGQKAKGYAIFAATINTAQAVTSALATTPFVVGLVLAALAAAKGAIEIAAIKAQPIPLKKGGILTKPTFSPDGSFVAGEAGPELVAPLSSVPSMVREIIRDGGAATAGRGVLIIKVYIGEREIEDFVVQTVERRASLGRLTLASKAVR